MLAGAILLTAGVGINVWAAHVFKQAHTPIRPDDTPRTIAERGPFRWSRNPMYVGLIALHLGAALMVGDIVFWISTLVYAGVLRVSFIPHEERVLRETFGFAYDDYAARVFRWFGRRRRPAAKPRTDVTDGSKAQHAFESN